jgi:hypothetical protein
MASAMALPSASGSLRNLRYAARTSRKIRTGNGLLKTSCKNRLVASGSKRCSRRAYAHLVHGVQDLSLHRLEPIPGVREGSGVDHRLRVLQEAGLHLGGDVEVDDSLYEVILDWCRCSGHQR